jgi:cell division initiation protein
VSSGEAGPPLVASGEQIRQREFATVRRGYDPEQVRAYLTALAVHVESLERALADARARVSQLQSSPPTPDAYEELSKRFAGVLATADAQAEQVVDQARADAERIKAEAQARAEEVRIRSSRSLIAAQEESDRMLENLAQRREAMLRQLHDMQSRLLSVADDLEVAIQPPPPPETSPPSPARSSFDPPVAAPPPSAPVAPSPQPSPVEDLWVSTPDPGTDRGLAGLFDEPDQHDEPDLPDLRDLDLDLGEDRDR